MAEKPIGRCAECRLRDLERSGLTQREFAERIGVPLSTLTWWRRKLGQTGAGSRGRERSRSERRPGNPFLEVQLTDGGGGGGAGTPEAVEIALPGGAVARIGPGVGEDLLRRFFRAAGVTC